MRKLIKALKRRGRKDLAQKVSIAVFDAATIIALPDTPQKIVLLKQYLVELRARRLVEDPIEFLTKNEIIITEALFEDITKEKTRYEAHLLRTDDYALELFWMIRNFVETIVARYTTDRGQFPVELDIVGLRTMLESL